jgi:hypothetical protein
MKMLFLATVLVSLNVFAVDVACFTDNPLSTANGKVTAVVLNNIDGPDMGEYALSASLPDQNTLVAFELSADGKEMQAGFSNECDNMYTVFFPAKQFKSFTESDPTVTPMRGRIEYSDANGDESSVKMICRRI